MAANKTAPVFEVLECGCSVEVARSGDRRVAGKCPEAAELFAETKRAGDATHDPKIKGGAKVKLVREFDRRRTAFREHIGVTP